MPRKWLSFVCGVIFVSHVYKHICKQGSSAKAEAAGCAAACGVLRGPNLLQVQAPQHAILLHPGVAHAAGMLAAARIEAQLRRQQECFPQSSNEPCWHCSKESLPILCFNGDGRH